MAVILPPQVKEFHSIMPIANIPSVMKRGILSHDNAAQLSHVDVSMADVQNHRDRKRVPNGLRLHQYANLYFDARNPMMYKRQNEWKTLCVLRISTDVLNIKGVVLTDCNAACSVVRFLPPEYIAQLKLDRIYAKYWTHDDEYDMEWHKKQKCAEVLIPDCCPPEFIIGAYVKSSPIKKILMENGFNKPILVKPYIFFG